MNNRRFILFLIVGLLTFLIGVTAAIALGGFDPLDRFTRSSSRRQYMIPPQPLSGPTAPHEHYSNCPYTQPRTAELRFRSQSLTPPPPPPAPVEPAMPSHEESETVRPDAPRATR
jgi:hypothetical protein